MNRMFKVREVGAVDVGGPLVVDEAQVVVVDRSTVVGALALVVVEGNEVVSLDVG